MPSNVAFDSFFNPQQTHVARSANENLLDPEDLSLYVQPDQKDNDEDVEMEVRVKLR